MYSVFFPTLKSDFPISESEETRNPTLDSENTGNPSLLSCQIGFSRTLPNKRTIFPTSGKSVKKTMGEILERGHLKETS